SPSERRGRMQSHLMQEHELLLAQLDALADTGVEAAERADFRGFLRHYYESASLDALRLRTPEELFRICRVHWQLARQRRNGELLLQLTPPADDAARTLARRDTVVDDMPVLVDSLYVAVRAAGSSIVWTVHPV